MTTIAEQIAAHFGSLPTLEPESVAVRYQGTETSWGQLGLVADGILECLAAAGVPEGSSIGWIARNDPALLGALIGLIKGGYTVSPVNPHQPVQKIAQQLRSPGMAASVGVAQAFHPECREALSDPARHGATEAPQVVQ